MYNLFKTRRFVPLLLTQFGGAFNDNVFKQSLVVLVVFSEGLRGSFDPKMLVTLAAGLFILPYVLFSTLAGELADKFEKSKLVKIIKWVELVLMLLVGVGLATQQLWLLLFVLFAMGAQSTFFSPLKYSLLPDHLKQEELLAGNAIIEASTFLSILTGNIAGTLLIVMTGGAEIVTALLVAVSIMGILASRKIPIAGPFEPQLHLGWNLPLQTWRLVRRAFSDKVVGRCILGISWFWFVGAAFLSQFPLFARQVLHGDETLVAILLTAFSIGIGIGSFACEHLLKGRVDLRFMVPSLLMMGVLTTDVYIASQGFEGEFFGQLNGWRIMADLVLIAVFGGIYIVPLNTLLQKRAESSQRARMIAANNIVNAIFMVAASASIAVLYAFKASIISVFLLIGICNIILAGYIWIRRRNKAGGGQDER